MEQYIRITGKKMIYLSSSCAKFIGERCDLYECGNVTALVSAPLGRLHLGKKSAHCQGKNLCSEEVVRYLISKYKAPQGIRLPAWTPSKEDAAVVFFASHVTATESKLTFGPWFKMVEFSYQKRHGNWVYVEDCCISFTEGLREGVPQKLTLLGDGIRLALVENSEGEYIFGHKNGRKGGYINSARLSSYLRNTFGDGGRSVLFHARPVNNGVCFALREEDLLPLYCNCALPQVVMGVFPDLFISINSNASVYFSSKAAKSVGHQLNLHYVDGWLALGGSDIGDISVINKSYQNYAHSKLLQKIISHFYPDSRKIFLLKKGPLFVLLQQNSDLDVVPDYTRFFRVPLWPKKASAAAGIPRPNCSASLATLLKQISSS